MKRSILPEFSQIKRSASSPGLSSFHLLSCALPLCFFLATLPSPAQSGFPSSIGSNKLLAQGAPSPGGNLSDPGSAPAYSSPLGTPTSPTPGAVYTPRAAGPAAPIPGTQAHLLGAPNSTYRRLPLNYQHAAVRLEELRNIMVTAKPKEFQDAIGDYLDWLADMADAHWKIYQAFSKVDSMKPQADVEKQSTLKIGQLKRQAMLLKAEFLIRENRQPEALQPLVDIVVAEPKTATGEAAYSLLKQIGFSEEISLNALPRAISPIASKAAAQSVSAMTANQKAPANKATQTSANSNGKNL